MRLSFPDEIQALKKSALAWRTLPAAERSNVLKDLLILWQGFLSAGPRQKKLLFIEQEEAEENRRLVEFIREHVRIR